MPFSTALLWLTAFAALAPAHHHGPPPDEATLDLNKLPEPRKIEGVGAAHITVTTKSPEAQRWFDQGLSLMHCFWDYEALRAFEQSARLDPDCALCHWGLYRALDFRGSSKADLAKQELAKAKELGKKASDHEQRYIRAYAESADKDGDEAGRIFAKQMEALIYRYPDDLEAKLELAGQTGAGYDATGDPRPGTEYAQAMLRNLLREYPDNPAVNHYWIHAVESSAHPEWAIPSAEKLGSLTPGSGHMVHMPGHIFYRVGDYERARQIFLAAMRVDRDYMERQHVAVRDDWNYAHNISYLIADCAEEGRYDEGLEHARTLAGLAADPDHSGAAGFYIFQVGSSQSRLALRFARYDDAIAHPMDFGVPDDRLSVWARGYRDGLITYARGMRALETNQVSQASEQSTQLDALIWRLSQEDLEKDDDKNGRDRVLKLLGTASLELRGDVAGARGDFSEGRLLLERAATHQQDLGYSEPPQYSRSPRESLGWLEIRAKRFDEARAAFRKVLEDRPNSGFALYGIAAAWDAQGKRDEAVKAYKEFLNAWSHADRSLAQIQTATAYLAQHGAVSGGL